VLGLAVMWAITLRIPARWCSWLFVVVGRVAGRGAVLGLSHARGQLHDPDGAGHAGAGQRSLP
jgi:hypothetical protein